MMYVLFVYFDYFDVAFQRPKFVKQAQVDESVRPWQHQSQLTTGSLRGGGSNAGACAGSKEQNLGKSSEESEASHGENRIERKTQAPCFPAFPSWENGCNLKACAEKWPYYFSWRSVIQGQLYIKHLRIETCQWSDVFAHNVKKGFRNRYLTQLIIRNTGKIRKEPDSTKRISSRPLAPHRGQLCNIFTYFDGTENELFHVLTVESWRRHAHGVLVSFVSGGNCSMSHGLLTRNGKTQLAFGCFWFEGYAAKALYIYYDYN